jgi:hypothetical protein
MVDPLTVNACSCAELPSIEDQLNRKTAIFTGKLLSLTKPVKDGNPDRLETGLCKGTKTLASAKEELKTLGAGYEPSKIPQRVPLGTS